MFNTIEVKVYGFNLIVYDENDSIYEFFIPMDKSRISKREAMLHIPELHSLYDIKRTNKTYKVDYEDLQKISIN